MRLIWVGESRSQVNLPGMMASQTVPLGGIDWSREAAVVIDLGEQRTGGYGVQVRAVRVVAPDRVELDLDLWRPGPDAMVTQAFTHPYAVAKVGRQGLGPGPVTLVAFDQHRHQVARQVVTL